MQPKTKSALVTPIMSGVRLLNQYILQMSSLPPKKIQHTHVQAMLANAERMYIYTIRQLRGKDYYKRIYEIVTEIAAEAYLIYDLHGWDKKVVVCIDRQCDEIIEHLHKIVNANKDAGIIKFTDEDK